MSEDPDAPEPAGEAGVASVVRSEERLRTDLRRHPIAIARLRKRIVTEQRTITVEVRHEEADLEILPPRDDAESSGLHVALPELTLYEEQIVVTRRLVPVERVRLAVTPVTTVRTITADVRHEEIALNDPATGDDTTRADHDPEADPQ